MRTVFVSGSVSEENIVQSEDTRPTISHAENQLNTGHDTGENFITEQAISATGTTAGTFRPSPGEKRKRPMEPLRSLSKRSRHPPKYLLEYKL